MRRRNRHEVRASLERFEPRTLLSAIMTIMATQPRTGHLDKAGAMARAASGFVPSTTSIAVPENQGAQGTNFALAPTGNLSPHEVRREQYSATFIGSYMIGPGRTDTEAQQVLIRGAGASNHMLHGDLQMRLVVPKDPTIPVGGVSAIFDRNINSNSTLGLDLTAPQTSVDGAGRPSSFSMSLDTNESSGIYDEGFATGTVSIRYLPSGKHTPGVLDQGTAIVKIRGQIYTTNVDFILANSDINPGGPSQGGVHHHIL